MMTGDRRPYSADPDPDRERTCRSVEVRVAARGLWLTLVAAACAEALRARAPGGTVARLNELRPGLGRTGGNRRAA